MSASNRLGRETSLYLRQHAANPVNWYPWGPEALGRARELDWPIFLSIGYSACHWCHVMERECFENAAVAALMNQSFVCIKVDREERPDIDDIYMKAVQLLNRGQGGWPMSVWLTPSLQPFYAGTYFPPEDRYGRPGFPRVLASLATAWRDRRTEISESANHITEHVRAFAAPPAGEPVNDIEGQLRTAATALAKRFDSNNGGFGTAPKFPHALELRYLLRAATRFSDANARSIVTMTLDKMARGGIYDQIGGGFHRYSVDEYWLVPHFEKMLYDNALLSLTYLEAFQATRVDFYRQISIEILEYVQREMTSEQGGFYSTQDADSEGVEGKFYVWDLPELESSLEPADVELAKLAWGISPGGNFEGRNILFRSESDEAIARRLNLPLPDFRSRLQRIKSTLLARRSVRVWPARDEKILTSWNGLMITSFAQAGLALGRPDFLATATKAADFVLQHLRTPAGRLLRTASADGDGRLNAYLEDYANVADAMTHLYEATLNPRWLTEAAQLAEVMISQFRSPSGAFFSTSNDHEELLLRPMDIHDGSTPSGNSMAIIALLRLSVLLGRTDLREVALQSINALSSLANEQPAAVPQLLIALDLELGPIQEIRLQGDPESTEVQRVLRAARARFAPHRIMVPPDPSATAKSFTMIVCERQSCRPAIANVAEAEDMLLAES